MKQIYNVIGLIFCIVLVIGTTQVDAQESELMGDLMFHGVFPTGELDTRFEDTVGIGVGLTYKYNRYAGVNTSMNYLSFYRAHGLGNLAIWHWNLNGRLELPIIDNLSVYAMGGLGLYIWSTNRAWWTDYQSKDGANLGINYGGGISYRIGQNMEAGLQFNRHSLELKDHKSDVQWNEFSVGMRFLLDSKFLAH